MWLIVVNAVVFAILLVIVVVPPLFIYDPDKHPNESLGPPSAGEVIPSDSASASVKQKLYMLFIIPACACANIIFFYFTYYRPMRYVVYRVELNTLSLYQNRLYGDQLLRNVGMDVLPTTSVAASARRTASQISYRRQPVENVSVVASNAAAESSSYRINVALRSHARPKTVRRDVYVSAAVLPEIKALRTNIEKNFLEPSELSEKSFLDAVHAAVDSFIVADGGAPLIAIPDSAAAGVRDGFYTSSKPRLALDIGKGTSDRRPPVSSDALYHDNDSFAAAPNEPFRRAHRSMVLLVSDQPFMASSNKKDTGSPLGAD